MSLKREIVGFRRYTYGCCPGHDLFPTATYKNRRSKRKELLIKLKNIRWFVIMLRN